MWKCCIQIVGVQMGHCSRIARVCIGMTCWLADALCVDVDQCNEYAKTKKKKKHLPRCGCMCACVQICCVQTQISVNKKNKTKKTYWWEGVVGKVCGPVACVWTRTGDVNALVLGHIVCACRWIACGHG